MLGRLLKLYAYTKKPKTTFVVLNPVTTAQLLKIPFDLKTAYVPRLTALATALLVAPLAYRLGKRSAEGTLFTPGAGAAARPPEIRVVETSGPR
jgi:hypothetical protein